MSSLYVENRPYGFEVHAPSFLYWVKAGFGFSVGAAVVAVVVYAVCMILPTLTLLTLASLRAPL